jgi:hypothetical protein
VSATTGVDLLARAQDLALVLRDSHDPITITQWEQFDVTLHRVLHETLGVDAGYVRLRDPSRTVLRSALRSYPDPLRPNAPHPAQDARVVSGEQRVRGRNRPGRLHAVRGGDAASTGLGLDGRSDITPADPDDPHPLARLSVTLGALADQLNLAHQAGQPALHTPGEAATTARHLLAIARTAAGRTLAAIPYADAARPLAVAQYTERVLDTLAGAITRPASLDELRTVTPHPDPQTLNDRLEAALHTWATAARADLSRPVPAAEGIRFLANQTVHLNAITHQLIQVQDPPSLDPDGATTVILTTAARLAQRADPMWAKVTTLARPTLEYLTASRGLIPVLDDVTTALQGASPAAKLDTRRALVDLAQTSATIADLMNATRTLPDRLARSQLLHTPKGRTMVVDLHSRRRLLTRPVNPDDVAELATTWTLAGGAASAAATQLHRVLATQADHLLHALAPLERTL